MQSIIVQFRSCENVLPPKKQKKTPRKEKRNLCNVLASLQRNHLICTTPVLFKTKISENEYP